MKGRAAVFAAVACALFGVAGCGEGDGVSAGATAAAYVEAPLCAGARRELARQDGRAGEVRVQAVCLEDGDDGERLDLAMVGANARQASEDAAAVGYLEPPVTPSFSRPIVEAAGIAVLRDDSGAAAMGRLLSAIRDAGDSGSLRESVRAALE